MKILSARRGNWPLPLGYTYNTYTSFLQPERPNNCESTNRNCQKTNKFFITGVKSFSQIPPFLARIYVYSVYSQVGKVTKEKKYPSLGDEDNYMVNKYTGNDVLLYRSNVIVPAHPFFFSCAYSSSKISFLRHLPIEPILRAFSRFPKLAETFFFFSRFATYRHNYNRIQPNSCKGCATVWRN